MQVLFDLINPDIMDAREWLKNTVVVIDPSVNPDGYSRYIQWYYNAANKRISPMQTNREHHEPWPGGRSNHYNFDLNRDWFAVTQPETRGRIKMLLEWFPLVATDLHEMGSDATYYFAPEAVPYNPHLTRQQRESLDWFGRNNARWFDQFGFN